MIKVLLGTGSTLPDLATDGRGITIAPDGKLFCFASPGGLTLSSSPTSLVVLRLRSVGEFIGREGFDGSELDRLGGKAVFTALVPGDVEGD